MRIAPRSRASWNVQVTVWPAPTMIELGGLPVSQVLDTRFQPAGTVSATSYVPGSSWLNVRESFPAAPGAVVVNVKDDGLSVSEEKRNGPKPSSVIFSTMIVARARFVYVQSRMSAGSSMANVTSGPLMVGVTPVLALQLTLTKSQPGARTSSVTV